jgi:protein required for attachment to host cells
MKNIWVVVADGRRARIFYAKAPRGQLNEIEALTQPDSALSGKDIWSDAPGRTFDRSGKGRHSMEVDTGHREQAKIEFARRIGKRIESAYHAGEFGRLVLVSEPSFLGHLRRQLNHNGLQKTISQEVDKDLTLMPPDKLRAQLPDKLASAIE